MINWKLRLKNKTTLMAIIAAIIAFVYQVLAMLDIVPAIGQDALENLVALVINALCMLGIVVDPTTSGITDSERAMTYEEPYEDK